MTHMEHAEHAGLLPTWVRIAWIIAFCTIAVVHLRHVWVMTGQRRYWHVGHVVMAAGMAHMYLPHPAQLVPAAAGMAVFAIAAGAALAAAV